MSAFTLGKIKDMLGICSTVTVNDAQFSALIPVIQGQIEKLTGLTFTPTTGSIWCSGNWYPQCVLPVRPVRAVTAVRIWPNGSDNNLAGQQSPSPTAPDPLTPGQDYSVRDFNQTTPLGVWIAGGGRQRPFLERVQPWPGSVEWRYGRVTPRKVPGKANIQVTLDYGFPANDIPSDLLYAVALGVRYAANLAMSGGLINTSAGLDGASVGLSAPSGGASVPGMVGLPGDVMAILANYVPLPFMG